MVTTTCVRRVSVLGCVLLGCGGGGASGPSSSDADLGKQGRYGVDEPARGATDDGLIELKDPKKSASGYLGMFVDDVGSTTNLTTEGLLDWSHWGRDNLKARIRKASGA